MPEELIPIFLFASIAAVAIFRPLTKRIGLVIERAYEERTNPEPRLQRLTELMERLVDRIDRLEDRLDFTERVLLRQGAAPTLTEDPASRHSDGPERRRDGRRESLSSL